MPESLVNRVSLVNKVKFVKPLLGFLAICSLSACGFAPVYNTKGSGIGYFEIAPIDGRIGYFLKRDLKEFSSLEGNKENARILTIKIKSISYNTNLRTNSFTTRTQINYDVNYELSASEGKPAINGFVRAIAGFDSPENKAYSEVALLQDAEERAANEISQKIWQDIILKTK